MDVFDVPEIHDEEPVIKIGVEECNPFGWIGVVWIDGREVYRTTFGKSNMEDPPLFMAATLANFLDDDPEIEALEPHRERFGAFWGPILFPDDA